MHNIDIKKEWSSGESMFDVPYYFWKNFFSSEEVDTIIEIAETNQQQSANTFDGNNDGIRDSKVIWIDYKELQGACDKIWSSMVSTNEDKDGWNLDVRGFGEKLQYTVYDKPGTFYGIHRDIGPNYMHRKISLSLQLSDSNDYTGGDFEINGELIPHRDKGDLIMFPSIMPHQVLPIKTGIRKSIVIWLTGPKLR